MRSCGGAEVEGVGKLPPKTHHPQFGYHQALIGHRMRPQPGARLAKPVWISRCETKGCRGARHRVGKTQVSRLIKTKA